MSSPQAQRSPRLLALTVVLLAATACFAGDLRRIPLPKRSKPTPVQKFNQQGVQAIQKHDYGKAKKLFYKAYLIDPNDPFTLNNLGYVSELEGDLDRAERFYALAAEHPSEAIVAKASDKAVVGKEVDQIAGSAADQRMEINRLNVTAIGLLEKDRVPEADQALQKALALDSQNPFTLNNLGYAKEKEGNLKLAPTFYLRSAATNSTRPGHCGDGQELARKEHKFGRRRKRQKGGRCNRPGAGCRGQGREAESPGSSAIIATRTTGATVFPPPRLRT